MKIPITILFLCCVLALAIIPLQATAFSAYDSTRTVGAGGNTFQFASSPIIPPGYSGIYPTPGVITSGCHEGCLCSVVEFEYIEDNQTDVNRPKLWSTRLGLLAFPLSNTFQVRLSKSMQSFHIPSFL
jgi:hypothetical protein